MRDNYLPKIYLNDWKDTRDTLQKYCRVLGAIRESLTEPHPHWWNISLRVSNNGLTTTPLPVLKDSNNKTFEVLLDLQNHKLRIESDHRETKQVSLRGQSQSALYDETCSLLSDIGVRPPAEKSRFNDGKPGKYDFDHVIKYWGALRKVNFVLRKFSDELEKERSPVQLWPHHFDLSFSWFSGRLVPGKDPADAESSKEQIMFGFSTGDKTIPNAYFYVLPYPVIREFPNVEMPEDTIWNTEGFTGGVMMYDSLANAEDPEKKLLNFLRTLQLTIAKIMK